MKILLLRINKKQILALQQYVLFYLYRKRVEVFTDVTGKLTRNSPGSYTQRSLRSTFTRSYIMYDTICDNMTHKCNVLQYILYIVKFLRERILIRQRYFLMFFCGIQHILKKHRLYVLRETHECTVYKRMKFCAVALYCNTMCIHFYKVRTYDTSVQYNNLSQNFWLEGIVLTGQTPYSINLQVFT